VSEATTGGSSAANTGNTGTASVEMQPPFVALVFIIRAS
jgi:hypothetical protein